MRKTRHISYVFMVSVIMFGCVTPKHNYKPKPTAIKKPPIGIISKVSVGNSLLIQGKFTEQRVLQIDRKINFASDSLGLIDLNLTPGDYIMHGNDENYSFFHTSNSMQSGRLVGSLAVPAFQFKSIQAFKKDPKICIINIANEPVCISTGGYKQETKEIYSDDGFKQTLIYNGKYKDKIKIGYREFYNNKARPAFSNEVEYDIGQSKIIGYKNAKLEIIEATNQFIKYKVISHFDD